MGWVSFKYRASDGSTANVERSGAGAGRGVWRTVTVKLERI